MKKLILGIIIGMLTFAPLAVADDDEEAMFRMIDQKLDMLIEKNCPPIAPCPPVVPCPPKPICPPCAECVVEFIYTADQLPEGAALTVYRVYTAPDRRHFLIPTWAIQPTPQPPVDPPPVIEPPIPIPLGPVKDNACLQCHEDDDGRRFLLSNSRDWKAGDSGHEKHEKQTCLKCHTK